MASTSKRFSEVDIDKILESASNMNTLKSEKYAWSLLEKFCLQRPTQKSSIAFQPLTIEELVSLPIADLDCILSQFFASIRKDDGTLLKKNTLDNIKYAINRRLKNTYNININWEHFTDQK